MTHKARVLALLSDGSLDGLTVDEIIVSTGVSRRTVFRALAESGRQAARKRVDQDAKWWPRRVELVIQGSARVDQFGYRHVYLPMHPQSNVRGEVAEHRLIAERKIGRFLRVGELVHHGNENRLDNRPENLSVVSKRLHQQLHANRRRVAA